MREGANMEKIIDMMKTAYITEMGLEAWERLTDEQKHDAIMLMAKDSLRALDRIEGRARA